MTRWIALFRGINVGGNNILPMKELVVDLESLNLKNVRTYIQSGNVVFTASQKNTQTLANKIEEKIESRHGFRPRVFVLSVDELEVAKKLNPFPQAEANPKTLHLLFLASAPTKAALDKAIELKSPSESVQLAGSVLYLYAPDGIGRSKFAAKVEKTLGVAATGRNWRTVEKLAELVDHDL